jgi:L-ornithine Nalpha-acyltransferase
MERTDTGRWPPALPSLDGPSRDYGYTSASAENALPNLLERLGPFELRLCSSEKELKKIQRLRYKVFYKEGHAIADRLSAILRRDICPFDAVCDHLFVVDTEAKTKHGSKKAKVVGTYRLLRGDVAARHSGFYSQSEFDLAPIIARHPETRLLELGRSCVHSDYRAKRVIELLWRGLWLYAKHHRIDVMMGCASLPTTDAEQASGPLETLRRHASLPADWEVTPLSGREANISSLDDTVQDDRQTLANLPPLLKAYLRAGARFSSGAVLDRQFGTIDVFAVMPMSEIDKRYLAHFGADSGLASGSVA